MTSSHGDTKTQAQTGISSTFPVRFSVTPCLREMSSPGYGITRRAERRRNSVAGTPLALVNAAEK